MDDILELAARLGKRIAEDPRGRRMAQARADFERSREDCRLLEEFERQQIKLQTLEAQGRPIEPIDKRRMIELQDKVIASPVLKNLLRAQADYVELMNLVSQRIEEEALLPVDNSDPTRSNAP